MRLINKYADMEYNEDIRPLSDFDSDDYFNDHYGKDDKEYNWEDDSTQMPREKADDLIHSGEWKKLLGDLSDVDDPDFNKNSKNQEIEVEEEEPETEKDPVHKELEDLLVSFYNLNDIDRVSANVDTKDAIHIYIIPKRHSSTLDEIQNILHVSNRVSKDILHDYYPEFDLWETTSKSTKRDEPLITISFYKDKMSNSDEDDEENPNDGPF